MTLHLLDTNILSDLIRNPTGRVAQRIRDVGEAAIATSVIVAAELRYGAAREGSPTLTRRVEELLEELVVPPFETPAEVEYGAIRSELEAGGQPIGGNDLLIAAHARAIDAVLVTANEREFERVPGLSVENWLI